MNRGTSHRPAFRTPVLWWAPLIVWDPPRLGPLGRHLAQVGDPAYRLPRPPIRLTTRAIRSLRGDVRDRDHIGVGDVERWVRPDQAPNTSSAQGAGVNRDQVVRARKTSGSIVVVRMSAWRASSRMTSKGSKTARSVPRRRCVESPIRI